MLSDRVYLCPLPIRTEVLRLLNYRFLNLGEYHGPIAQWAGEDFVAGFANEDVSEKGESAIGSISRLCEKLLYETHQVGSVRFLSAPWEGDPPLLEKVLIPMKQAEMSIDVESVLQKMAEDPGTVEPIEKELIYRKIEGDNSFFMTFGRSVSLPIVVEFEQPFDKYFAYEWEALNLRHPASQALIKATARLFLAWKQKTLTEEQLGCLFDAFHSLPCVEKYYFQHYSWKSGVNIMRRFYELCKEIKMFHVGEIEEIIPSPKEFIPGTIEFDSDSRKLVTKLRESLKKTADGRPFGMTLIQEKK